MKKMFKSIKLLDLNSVLVHIDEKAKINDLKGSHSFDVEVVQRHKPLPNLYRELLTISDGIGFLAGGSVRHFLTNKDKKDIPDFSDFDFYAYSKKDRGELVKRFVDNKFKIKNYNENCVMLERDGVDLQVITSFVGSPKLVIDEFDFTVCRVGMELNKIYRDKDFDDHSKRKLLVIKTIQCPLSGFRRVIKYCKKGFRITSFQLVKYYESYAEKEENWKDRLHELLEELEDSESGMLEKEDFDELEQILIKVD